MAGCKISHKLCESERAVGDHQPRAEWGNLEGRAGEEENTDQDGTIWAMEEKERI